MSTSSIRFLYSAQPDGPHRYLLRVSDVEALGLLVTALDEPGVLYRISEAIFRHGANITYIAGGAHREQLAQAVRAVARLHRARALVLAGALMGGDIAKAVREIKDAGIIVLCTNMAGSVPDAADVVVSDPVEAGVMAVMLIADTASFSIEHVRGRRF